MFFNRGQLETFRERREIPTHHALLDDVGVPRPFRDSVELYHLLLPSDHEVSQLALPGAVRHPREAKGWGYSEHMRTIAKQSEKVTDVSAISVSSA